ncbi:unnamed protein product, partial [Brassica rapa]
DTHGRPECADGQPQTATNVLCVLADTHRHTRTATDVLCVLTDSHGQAQTCCVCWWTPTDVLCVLNRQPTWAKITQTSTGRASMLSPRTNVLICVLMDSHGRPVHGHPMCADGQSRTSCVCWQTPTDVLCVLNRQPTWAKITQIVHVKGQRAESKDQRADMCTDGQPRTSSTDTHGHTQTATEVLCVLVDTHGRPVSPAVLCVLTDTHGRPVCAEGHPQTSCVYQTDSPHGPKSPKQSTGRDSVLSPRTSVLICVLMDSHGRPVHVRSVCADGHTRTNTDSPRCPVCVDGHTRTQPTWAKISQTVHRKGQCAESKDQRADMSTYVLCVLMDTHGQTRTAPDVLCVLTDTHGRHPRMSCVCWRTPTAVLYVLCVLADSHRRPMCTEQTAHVGQNHPNSPREGPAC